MDLYKQIEQVKKALKLTNIDLGAVLNKSGDTFRKSLKRRSLSDYEIQELARAIINMRLDDTTEKNELVKDLNNGIRTKIMKNKSLILDKILPIEEEEKLKKDIKGDPAYFDLEHRTPIKIASDPETDYNAIPVNFKEMSVMHVPLVNKYAYAGYLNGFGDDEWIEELPKIPFANDVENKGDYLCFEVKGDSMDDGSYEAYLEGDILLCRNVRQDFWKSKLHIHKWDFVIVHKEMGILVKRILNHNVPEGILTLHSLNEYYDDFEVHLKDVAKIFNIVDFRRKKSRR